MTTVLMCHLFCYFQSASWRHQRQAALVLGEVQAKVASQEERAQELLLRTINV